MYIKRPTINYLHHQLNGFRVYFIRLNDQTACVHRWDWLVLLIDYRCLHSLSLEPSRVWPNSDQVPTHAKIKSHVPHTREINVCFWGTNLNFINQYTHTGEEARIHKRIQVRRVMCLEAASFIGAYPMRRSHWEWQLAGSNFVVNMKTVCHCSHSLWLLHYVRWWLSTSGSTNSYISGKPELCAKQSLCRHCVEMKSVLRCENDC